MIGWFKRSDSRLRKYYKQLECYKRADKMIRFPHEDISRFPCLDDDTGNTPFDAHYIYHPAWAARIIAHQRPAFHTDISSTLHFCSLLSAFVPTRFYDFRPASLTLDGLSCGQADLTDLNFSTGSLPSVSCMHTIEHIGLGRYGDQIDPQGDLKAFRELQRVCAPGGDLLIAVPVGRRKLAFNAHRIYDPTDIPRFMNGSKLQSFSLVDDLGKFQNNASMEEAACQQYGCGCYWFVKI